MNGISTNVKEIWSLWMNFGLLWIKQNKIVFLGLEAHWVSFLFPLSIYIAPSTTCHALYVLFCHFTMFPYVTDIKIQGTPLQYHKEKLNLCFFSK